MEDWQRKLIIANLPQLCEFTDCNLHFLVILQSRDMLSQFDVDTIIQAQTNFEKTAKLYSILLSRTGAFDEIKSALDVTRQSGALNILTRYTHPGAQIIGGLTINRHHLIGLGRYGTKAFSGIYGDKKVAVKFSPCDDFDYKIMLREIRQNVVLETCKNVVRTFAVETIVSVKQIFTVLEICDMNLDQWIRKHCKNPGSDTSSEDILLQVLKGIYHLHTWSILHRDLKPSNILITLKGNTVVAKICDAGISKTIDETSPFFMNVDDGAGSEETRNRRFSLGCIMYYVFTNGGHPFGSSFLRISKILDDKTEFNQEDLKSPAWYHLIKWMLMHRPDCRPSTELILCHPVFWDRNKIFQFFVDLKTHLDINVNETLTKKLRSHKLQVSWLQNRDNFIIKSYFSRGDCTVAYFLNALFPGHDKYKGLFSNWLRLDRFQPKFRSDPQSYFPCIIHDLWYELKDFRDDVHLKKYYTVEKDGRYMYPGFPKYNI